LPVESKQMRKDDEKITQRDTTRQQRNKIKKIQKECDKMTKRNKKPN
jgi:predicted phosphohydrolase